MEFEHRPVLLEPTVDALCLPISAARARLGRIRSPPDAALRAERGVFVDGTPAAAVTAANC